MSHVLKKFRGFCPYEPTAKLVVIDAEDDNECETGRRVMTLRNQSQAGQIGMLPSQVCLDLPQVTRADIGHGISLLDGLHKDWPSFFERRRNLTASTSFEAIRG
jgi:hypothetical protein